MASVACKIETETLISDLIQFRKSKSLTDITLVAFGLEIPAHKCVLALHSNYFKTAFSGNFTESKEQKLDLSSHVVDPKGLETVVDYLYGGEVELTVGNFTDLTRLASYLEINRLSRHVNEFIEQTLSVHNCINYFVCLLASPKMKVDYGCSGVREMLKLFKSRFHDFFIQEEELLNVPKDLLCFLASKGVLKYCTMEQIITFLNNWLTEHSSKEDLEVVPTFLNAVSEKLECQVDACTKMAAKQLYQTLCQNGETTSKDLARVIKKVKKLLKAKEPCGSEVDEEEEVVVVVAPTAEALKAHEKNLKAPECECAIIPEPVYTVFVYRPAQEKWYIHSQLYGKDIQTEETCINKQFRSEDLEGVKGMFKNLFVLGITKEKSCPGNPKNVKSVYLLDLKANQNPIKKVKLSADMNKQLGLHATVATYHCQLYMCVPDVQPLPPGVGGNSKVIRLMWYKEDGMSCMKPLFATSKLIACPIPAFYGVEYDVAISEESGELLFFILVNEFLKNVYRSNLGDVKPRLQEIGIPLGEALIGEFIILEERDKSGFMILCDGDFEDDNIHNPVFKYSFWAKQIMYHGHTTDFESLMCNEDWELEQTRVFVLTGGSKYWHLKSTPSGRSRMKEVRPSRGGRRVDSKLLTPPPLPSMYIRAVKEIKEHHAWPLAIKSEETVRLEPYRAQTVHMSRDVLAVCQPVKRYPY